MLQSTLRSIIKKCLNCTQARITEIKGMGMVNQVFKVEADEKSYVIRINEEARREFEYVQEQWCIEQVQKLGIKSPEILSVGKEGEYHYMIQYFIQGKSGNQVSENSVNYIWEKLGEYARTYHQISEIPLEGIQDFHFHQNWADQLVYNIKELHDQDRLLRMGAFSRSAQSRIRQQLEMLNPAQFSYGLIHKDLSLRNVIYHHPEVYLIDWGMAEINIVPHMEIGHIMLGEGIQPKALQAFLNGLGMRQADFLTIQADIHRINLLDRLDKFRWASDHAIPNIDQYVQKLQAAWQACNP